MDLPYQQYFQAMPCYLTVQDRDLRVIAANQRFRNDFGDFEGRYCYQVYKHRSEKCESCPVERTFRDGTCHGSEEQVRCLDGREVSVIVYTKPILDEKGEITSVMEMSTDITELKVLQNQLRKSQQRYQALFEEVPCFISIQDRDLKIVESNRRFREAFGECLGIHCYKGYKHREEECIPCPVQETFQDGATGRSEEVVTTRDGSQRNVLVYTTPLRGDDGEIQSVMEMSTDITPIRELQSQLESMGLLISSVSHGIKGLLTGLDGGMYMVNTGMRKDNPTRLKKGWEMVQRNVERIRGMVLNILYYAKEREPNWEIVSAADLVMEVLGVIEPKAAEVGVEVECDVRDSAGVFMGDPNALRSLMVNLAENSIDACRVDGKKDQHKVRLSAGGSEEQVAFELDDNGIGMDQETRERAFSLFFSSKGSEGTGLGLFIADKIAQAHGGSVDLHSEVDKGTRFVVTIPRRPAEDSP